MCLPLVWNYTASDPNRKSVTSLLQNFYRLLDDREKCTKKKDKPKKKKTQIDNPRPKKVLTPRRLPTEPLFLIALDLPHKQRLLIQL